MTASVSIGIANLTIDADGRLVLPPEVAGTLRPDGESLTLVDVEVKDGVVVLRRSTIPSEDWWAYTPEHRAEVAKALAEGRGVRMTLAELERFVEDRGR